MLGHTGFLRSWRHRRWGLLAVVGTVLALTGIAIALVPSPSSQAATGTKWSTGVQHAGVLTTNTGLCSVTVISQWLAITAKHCGWVNPTLKLNVQGTSSPGVVPVKRIEVNRDLDVEAILLEKQTCCLTMTPLRGFVSHDPLSFWGYGLDRSNKLTNRLTRADFGPPTPCRGVIKPENGSLCWETTDANSLCYGDSGGPVLQNGTIVGMAANVQSRERNPDNSLNCGKVWLGQAITIKEMRTWLDQMITDADPFD